MSRDDAETVVVQDLCGEVLGVFSINTPLDVVTKSLKLSEFVHFLDRHGKKTQTLTAPVVQVCMNHAVEKSVKRLRAANLIPYFSYKLGIVSRVGFTFIELSTITAAVGKQLWDDVKRYIQHRGFAWKEIQEENRCPVLRVTKL